MAKNPCPLATFNAPLDTLSREGLLKSGEKFPGERVAAKISYKCRTSGLHRA